MMAGPMPVCRYRHRPSSPWVPISVAHVLACVLRIRVDSSGYEYGRHTIRPQVVDRRSYITSANISSTQAMNTSSVFIASAICITWCSGVQHLHSTRSSSLVTLAFTRTSSLRITDCFFLYASPCLWKQLRQPRTGFSMSVSPFVHLSVLRVLIHHSAEC